MDRIDSIRKFWTLYKTESFLWPIQSSMTNKLLSIGGPLLTFIFDLFGHSEIKVSLIVIPAVVALNFLCLILYLLTDYRKPILVSKLRTSEKSRATVIFHDALTICKRSGYLRAFVRFKPVVESFEMRVWTPSDVEMKRYEPGFSSGLESVEMDDHYFLVKCSDGRNFASFSLTWRVKHHSKVGNHNYFKFLFKTNANPQEVQVHEALFIYKY